MKWTKQTPTEPGWYWQKRTNPIYTEIWGDEKQIVHIRYYAGNLCIMNWPIPNKDHEWAGPIPEPEN